MITSKQRAYLRKIANTLDPVMQIGKGGVTDTLLEQISMHLESKEIIKIHILETALMDAKSSINEIAEEIGAEPVQAIGSKIVLYKQSSKKENRKIVLP